MKIPTNSHVAAALAHYTALAQRLLNIDGIGVSSSGLDDLEVAAKRLPNPKRIIQLIRENQ